MNNYYLLCGVIVGASICEMTEGGVTIVVTKGGGVVVIAGAIDTIDAVVGFVVAEVVAVVVAVVVVALEG